MAFEDITVSPGSYLTTFSIGSPPRNGSNCVKTGGVLMLPKWGCRGQEVPEVEARADLRSKGLRVQGSKGLRV